MQSCWALYAAFPLLHDDPDMCDAALSVDVEKQSEEAFAYNSTVSDAPFPLDGLPEPLLASIAGASAQDALRIILQHLHDTADAAMVA